MATDKKISDLNSNPTITGLEEIPLEKSDQNYKNTFDDLKTYVLADVPESGVQSVNGSKVDNTDPINPIIEATTKTDVDLGNVDNTSDVNKPVSTANQTALSLKADKATLTQSGGNVTGSIDTDTNTFSLTSSGGGGAVDSVNSQTGVVVLDGDDIETTVGSGTTINQSLGSLAQGQTGGLISFTTLAILNAYTDLGNNDSYKVTNDTTPTNNGYYHWSGSAYVQDSSLANGKIEEGNIEAVEGGKIDYELYNKGILYNRDNLLNTSPSSLLVGFRQNGTGLLVGSTGAYCAVGFTLLEQGETYSFSGDGIKNDYSGSVPRSALYLNIGDTSGTPIILTPITGGYSFTVGINETNLYFTVDVNTTGIGTDVISGVAMLENTNIVNSHKEYKSSLDDVYTTETYVNQQISNLGYEKINILNTPLYTGVDEDIPLFFKKWKVRKQDVTIIVYGDSLSVRTTNNTQFSNPENRPPLCQGKNWASAVWDKLKWGLDLFYRFDANGLDANPRFTEIETFVTVEPNATDTPSEGITSADWDDFIRREGITRMYSGTANASVTFDMLDSTVDKEGSLDFIYRTDLEGSEVNTVTIAEGNGLLKVWDGGAFIEANGYVFSMKHDTVSTYRGNTKYQDRLVFKAVIDGFDSRNSAKTITITKTDSSDSRFMFWGIQTSIERYVTRIISSGRGGLALDTLLPFIDDDVFDHKPDLIVHEIPINGGINVPNNPDVPQFYVDEVNTWFFDLGNPYSMKSKSNSWSDFEVVIWSPHTTEPVFLTDNSFVTQKNADGYWSGVADNWREIGIHIRDVKETGFYYVPMFERWLNESSAVYGSMKAGFLTTSTTSEDSFIRDGTHMNDLGVKIMNKHINSIFK